MPIVLRSIRSVAALELFIQAIIFFSVGMHFIEIEFTDSHHSIGFFLWSERIVAAIFTIEYLVRWTSSRRVLYPLQPMALVDLVAILPFYVGFFVDLRSLRLVRTLRVLRLFKLTRHSRALHSILAAFHRVRYEFGVMAFAVFIVVWCSSTAIYELERERQPEVFGKMSDAVWFVLTTVTTVGYGDKIPLTTGGRIVAACLMVAGLGLFGTFVSLIGSAFLEEIRKNKHPAIALPQELLQMTADSFDPCCILASVESGSLDSPSDPVHRETLRLLVMACRHVSVRSGNIG